MSDTLDPDEFLEQSSLPAVKFAKVGDTIKGDVIASRVGYQREFGTSEIAKWPDGTPKKQLQIDLRTTEGDMRLYCKPACKDAVRDALKASGGSLAAGGTLTVKRTEDGTPSQPGLNPPQQFKARFEPKAADTGVDDLDDF